MDGPAASIESASVDHRPIRSTIWAVWCHTHASSAFPRPACAHRP